MLGRHNPQPGEHFRLVVVKISFDGFNSHSQRRLGFCRQVQKRAVLVNIDCSLETRIARIIEDYPVDNDETRRQIEAILRSLKRNMGAELVDTMCRLLHEDKLPELVRILLVDYYDKRYGRSMSDYRFALEIAAEDLDEAAVRLEEFRRSLG